MTRWIFRFGLRKTDADRAHRVLVGQADRLGSAPWWVGVGALTGVLPFALAWATQVPAWALPTSLGLAWLMVLGAASGRPNRALAGVGAGMFSHCALAIALTAADPSSTALLLEDGPAYWEKTRHWVVTGESPEYTLSWWVPAHAQLVVATAFLSYISLGVSTLYEGMYEVGLMNHYVGNLVREARDPVTALLVGWHPWSVARGLGFLLITYDVVDFSLGRLLGRTHTTPRQRRTRWALGIAFVLLDAGLKLFLLEPIRQAIANAL